MTDRPEPLTPEEGAEVRHWNAKPYAVGRRHRDSVIRRLLATLDAERRGLREAAEGVMAAYDRTGWPDDDAMRALRAALAARPEGGEPG